MCRTYWHKHVSLSRFHCFLWAKIICAHSAHASSTADKGQGCNDEWDMRHSECMFGLRVSVKTNIDYIEERKLVKIRIARYIEASMVRDERMRKMLRFCVIYICATYCYFGGKIHGLLVVNVCRNFSHLFWPKIWTQCCCLEKFSGIKCWQEICILNDSKSMGILTMLNIDAISIYPLKIAWNMRPRTNARNANANVHQDQKYFKTKTQLNSPPGFMNK